MGIEFYNSQYSGADIDEQIGYVKNTLKNELIDIKKNIATKANDGETVKYSEKNQPNGYLSLNSEGQIDESFLSVYTETVVDDKIASMVDSAPEALNTLNELATALGEDPNFATTVATQIGNKVDKVDGMGLATNDYTDEDKETLNSLTTDVGNLETALSTQMGDIETALDAIITMQNELIGGESE